jgi:nucleoside-diphosphate-sugar epimerase
MKKRYKRIFVAGHNGLVGSSIYRCLQKIKNVKLITIDKKKINLEDQKKTKSFLKKNKPDYVILAAALAGGIWANEKYCADFIEKNIAIATLDSSCFIDTLINGNKTETEYNHFFFSRYQINYRYHPQL